MPGQDTTPIAPLRLVTRLRQAWFYAGAGLLIAALSSGAAPFAQLSGSPSAGPVSISANSADQPTSSASPMDEPLRLIAEARKSMQEVRDYTCVFVKRERLQGQLQPENQMAMKVRSKPFSVYLRWLSPGANVGQEACYVAGRNNGMMRAKAPGILGAVGWVSIDPNDPRAREHSKRSITEAGIGNLIERYGQRWEEERKLGLTQVRVSEYEFSKRRCTRVETIHPDNTDKHFLYYRHVLYFDKETKLPIRMEAYDWPQPGGNPDGELLEVYSYVNLRLNVNLGDDSFNY